MKLVAAKCPSCGADIEVDKDSDSTKCEYCKSKILVDDAIAKVKVEVSVKNMPKYEDYVKMGDKYYSEFLFREARTEYKKALEFDPNNIELLFCEKACRACSASFEKMKEDLVREAFDGVREKVKDKKEISRYAHEAIKLTAFIINKTTDHYRNNNLTHEEVIEVHYRIMSCADNIEYFGNFINEEDKEYKLDYFDYYISSMHLLTQDMKYRVNGTRKKSTYVISYDKKKKYVENLKAKQVEREKLLAENKELESKSTLSLPKTNYFASQQMAVYFIGLFIFNIGAGVAYFKFSKYYALGLVVANFFILLRALKLATNNPKALKKNSIISTIFLIISVFIAISIFTTKKYINNWGSALMYINIGKEEAGLKLMRTGENITGKYYVSCNLKSECTIQLSTYKFKYANDELCYLENDECTTVLKVTEKPANIPIVKKSDVCPETNNKMECNSKNYYVCSNGTEHKENACDFASEDKTLNVIQLVGSLIVGYAIAWIINKSKF